MPMGLPSGLEESHNARSGSSSRAAPSRSGPHAERVLYRAWQSKSLAQKTECARHTGERHDEVLAEAKPAVGHVDPFSPVLLDELVHVGDGRKLIMHGVVQVHRGRGGGLTEPVRHGAHPRYLEPARDRQVVAPMEEGKAQPELLDGHLGCRSHEGLTPGCEGAVQVDIRKLAADADATRERLSAEEVVVVEHPGP